MGGSWQSFSSLEDDDNLLLSSFERKEEMRLPDVRFVPLFERIALVSSWECLTDWPAALLQMVPPLFLRACAA